MAVLTSEGFEALLYARRKVARLLGEIDAGTAR